ncbi:MAG: hypothetical protein ACYDBX_02140 [Patescibacteria group bacterium]
MKKYTILIFIQIVLVFLVYKFVGLNIFKIFISIYLTLLTIFVPIIISNIKEKEEEKKKIKNQYYNLITIVGYELDSNLKILKTIKNNIQDCIELSLKNGEKKGEVYKFLNQIEIMQLTYRDAKKYLKSKYYLAYLSSGIIIFEKVKDIETLIRGSYKEIERLLTELEIVNTYCELLNQSIIKTPINSMNSDIDISLFLRDKIEKEVPIYIIKTKKIINRTINSIDKAQKALSEYSDV